MNGMKRLQALAFAALVASTAALVLAQVGPLHLRFEYEGGTSPAAWKPAGLALAIGTVTDVRSLEDPMRVGECQAVGPEATPVLSLTPVPDFVTQALQASLAKWKVNVSPEADRVLRCEVLQFWVLEKSRFAANVRFRFVLEDRAGAVLFQGEVANDDSTWGKTCSEKNYIQVLSLATQRAFVDLFNNKEFRAALTAGH
jgi:hypothetical protein